MRLHTSIDDLPPNKDSADRTLGRSQIALTGACLTLMDFPTPWTQLGWHRNVKSASLEPRSRKKNIVDLTQLRLASTVNMFDHVCYDGHWLTCLRLTFLCFLGSSFTSRALPSPLLLNLTLPCRCFLLAARSLAMADVVFSSVCNSAYHPWRSQSPLTAQPGSSKCWQLLNLHLLRTGIPDQTLLMLRYCPNHPIPNSQASPRDPA